MLDTCAMEITLIQKIAIWALPVLFAIILHEVAHGWVASWFGDQTARLSGRLTLNPIKHIDPVGTILVPLLLLFLTKSNIIFGWAKPVPVDPRNMRHPRRDMIFVSLAGPISNLLMAVFWAFIAKFGLMYQENNMWAGIPMKMMGEAGIMINVVLAVLNLIPLPPLDGGKVLLNMLPPRTAYSMAMIEPYSFFILILLLFSGLLTYVMAPPVIWLIVTIYHVFGLPLVFG